MRYYCHRLALFGVLSISACSSPFLEEGRYNLTTTELSNGCPEGTPQFSDGLTIDFVQVTDDYWGGDELNVGARLEGWFEGGGALGAGGGEVSFGDDYWDTDWTLHLYPAGDRQFDGRIYIDVTWEEEGGFGECSVVLDVLGAKH